MRAVIQRVSAASVVINNQETSHIGPGLLVLLGITHSDTGPDAEWLSKKITGLRIFSDPNDQMNLSVKEIQGQVMVVSQFTLFASTKKGNRPSFTAAARPEVAEPLYESFIKLVAAETGKPVATGCFGADMKITLTNDGPVTILIDSQNKD